MKKLFLISLMLLFSGLTYATDSKADRYIPQGEVLKHTKTLVLNDTVRDNDTMWCTELNISNYSGEFYSIGFDIDAINTTVAGEILIRQGNEKGNLQFYTSLFALSAAVDTTLDITTDVQPMVWLQVGITDTDDTDSLEVDYLSINKTQ